MIFDRINTGIIWEKESKSELQKQPQSMMFEAIFMCGSSVNLIWPKMWQRILIRKGISIL